MKKDTRIRTKPLNKIDLNMVGNKNVFIICKQSEDSLP